MLKEAGGEKEEGRGKREQGDGKIVVDIIEYRF